MIGSVGTRTADTATHAGRARTERHRWTDHGKSGTIGCRLTPARIRALAARRFGSDLPGAFAEDALAATLAWLGARRR
jgi:uncharacterized membrane protein